MDVIRRIPEPRESEIKRERKKFYLARKLKKYIASIRAEYTENFTSEDIVKRQKAVATYMIDKFAMRAGDEVDGGLFGCCTIKVGDILVISPNSFEFTHHNKPCKKLLTYEDVEAPVCEAIVQFQAGKQGSDDLFDKLNTAKLNAHLNELMPGLTAKVFRTYNASVTFDDILNKELEEEYASDKCLCRVRAMYKVAAIIHKKPHGITTKTNSPYLIRLKKEINDLKASLEKAKGGKRPKLANEEEQRSLNPEVLENNIAQIEDKILWLELRKNREERPRKSFVHEQISIRDYLDPRISIAWCRRHDFPHEKLFGKYNLKKYAWAVDVTGEFRF